MAACVTSGGMRPFSARSFPSWLVSLRRCFNYGVSSHGAHLGDTPWCCSISWIMWYAEPWMMSRRVAMALTFNGGFPLRTFQRLQWTLRSPLIGSVVSVSIFRNHSIPPVDLPVLGFWRASRVENPTHSKFNVIDKRHPIISFKTSLNKSTNQHRQTMLSTLHN